MWRTAVTFSVYANRAAKAATNTDTHTNAAYTHTPLRLWHTAAGCGWGLHGSRQTRPWHRAPTPWLHV